MFTVNSFGIAKSVALTLAIACVAGCAARQPGAACDLPPEGVVVAVVPGRPMNPGPDGESLPTNVRLHQLSSASGLGEMSAEAVWEDAASAFGPALLSTTELTVYPDEPVEQQLPIDPSANALVAVALVRRPVGNSWFAEAPLAPVRDRICSGAAPEGPAVRFEVHDHGVSLVTTSSSDNGAEAP